MTAPVVGSGSCPAWMQRVEKSSWFFCDIQASHSAVIPTRLECNPGIVDQVETGRHAEKLIAVHDDGDVVLAEQGQEIGNRRVGGNRLEALRHHLCDRPREGPVGILALSEQRGQSVALVY